MRKRDAPGTYRILNRGGTVVLSGVKASGERVKIPNLSRHEAESIAVKLFPASGFVAKPSPTVNDNDLDAWLNDDPNWKPVDRIKADDTGAVPPNATMGVGQSPPAPEPPKPTTSADDVEKKAKRAKHAKSLMELVGVGWAGGTIWIGRKTCERLDKEPPMPNPRQVNDLADCTRDTLTDYFGDREIQPWMMMLLLSIGIPLSMVMQAKPKKALPAAERDLKSIP